MKITKSKSFRLVFWSFICSIFFIFLGMFEELNIGEFHLKIKSVSPEIILFLLTPCLGLYGFRRYTNARYYRKELDDKTGQG
jgi:hypothetical protein